MFVFLKKKIYVDGQELTSKNSCVWVIIRHLHLISGLNLYNVKIYIQNSDYKYLRTLFR